MMTNRSSPPDWQSLAQQASQETDPEKLMDLVKRLSCALDREGFGSSINHTDGIDIEGTVRKQ